MKLKNFLLAVLVFFVLQILINITWGQLLRSPSVDIGRWLGILVFHLPFSVLGVVVLVKTRWGATKLGYLSLAFGILDETLALASGDASSVMISLTALQFNGPVLFRLFSTLTYWFAEWSVPAYAITMYMEKLNEDIQGTEDTRPWNQQLLIWVGILAGICIAVISYLDHFA